MGRTITIIVTGWYLHINLDKNTFIEILVLDVVEWSRVVDRDAGAEIGNAHVGGWTRVVSIVGIIIAVRAR